MLSLRITAPSHLLIGSGAVAIAILGLSFSGFLWASHQTQMAAAERTSAALALALDQHVETVIDAANAALDTAIFEIGDAERAGADRATINALLGRTVASHRHLLNAVITDAAGMVLYDPRSYLPPSVNLADRDMFTALRDHPDSGLLVGAPVTGRITGEPLIPMMRRLQDLDDGFAGVLSAAISIDGLNEFLRSLQVTANSTVGIVRADGVLLARQPESPLIGTSLAQTQLFQKLLPQAAIATVRIVSDLDHVERIVSYRASSRLPVVVFHAVSLEDALADWYRNARVTALIALFCAGIIGVLTYLLVAEARQREAAAQEARRNETQLMQSRKMEAVGRLAGGIAHDFNNILGAILGYAGFLVEDLAPRSSQHQFAERIVKAGNRAKELVQQILAFSRLETVERQPTDLAGIVHETKELISASLPPSTRLHIVQDAKGLVAKVNPAQVGQILINLCMNANDALNGEEGAITVTLSRVDPGQGHPSPAETAGARVVGQWDTSRSYACLCVDDTGIGMSTDQLQTIFEPFYTTKPRGRGTGLGLAVVHGSILACGGAGAIVSAPGEGTAFSVYFPLVEPHDAVERACSRPLHCRGSERVLVVDDEPMIADTTAIGLTRLGYDVTAVNDPAEALRLFGDDPARWQVVISDEAMPGMRGSTLFQRMRALEPALRFILCTGYSDGLTEEQRRTAGIEAYFHKPVPPEQLADKIRQMVAC